VSGQLHVSAALTPKKEPPVPIGQEVERTQIYIYIYIYITAGTDELLTKISKEKIV
jgi:hypothetical protein